MPNQYDRVIQENIDGLTKSLVRRIMNIESIDVIRLPRKVQRTMERELDSLLQIIGIKGNKALLNVEWQATNDVEMCLRMLLHHAHSELKFKLPVFGLVIYIGREPVNMPVSLDYENLKYHYQLIDLTELNPALFLESDVPEEIIMAVLAGKTRDEQKREIIRKILFKLRMLLHDNSEELDRKIAQLEIIGDLRNVQKIIVEEEQKMALTYNIERDIRYNQGLEIGIRKTSDEKDTAFITSLLQNTSHSIEEIAKLVNVPIAFVSQVKESLK